MALPISTGQLDLRTGIVYPPNAGTWANLASTREITISSNVVASTLGANITVGNVSFGNLIITNTDYYANTNVIILGTTTANIANISVGMKVYGANISSNVTVTSIRNSTTGIIWDTLSIWITEPADYFTWTSPLIDNEKNIIFNCLIDSEIVGNVSYEIATTQQAFDGNEVVSTVNIGDADIPAYEGRYLIVTANVRSTGSLTSLTKMDVRITNEPFVITRNSVYLGNLVGTSSSRQIDLGRNVSYITSLQMTPYIYNGGSGYTTSGYVVAGYFDETVVTGAFPQIIDKSQGGANVALTDNAGNFIDGYVDIVAYVLPEQYMDVDYSIRQR